MIGSHPDLEGILDSSYDDPPRWALMVKMHVDETIDAKSGMCIVGGYLGKRKHWKAYVEEWEKVRSPRESLHLKGMHLASTPAKRRYKTILAELGSVPFRCGLKPLVGSICELDYRDRVHGTVLEVIMAGYVMAIIAMLDEMAKHLAKDERVEVIFEQQLIYAVQRERAMMLWNSLPNHRTSKGRPIVAKWSSMEKGTLTEASDYLCYAMAQRDIDRTSQKAVLTAPILDAQHYTRNHTSREEVNRWIDDIQAKRKRPLLATTPEIRKMIRTMK
jgi:hypothetical protein